MRTRTETRTVESPTGKQLPEFIINPETGQPEQAVTVQYTFGGASDTGFAYRLNYPSESGRPGNTLSTSVKLPESMAREFEQIVRAQPGVARQFAKRIFAANVSAESMATLWSAGKRPICPPYSQLREMLAQEDQRPELSIVTPVPVAPIPRSTRFTGVSVTNVAIPAEADML